VYDPWGWFERYRISIAQPTEEGVAWVVDHFGAAFAAIRWPVERVLDTFEGLLLATPWPVVVLLFFLLGTRLANLRTGAFAAAALAAIGFGGYWPQTMTTLSMILAAVTFCVLVGIPLGILAALSDRFRAVLQPLLDAMQTVHPFVYLVPVVMFFGIGKVPGTISTIVFALPPIVRLTDLGIRQVPAELVEAGEAFGASRLQLLAAIQLPLAWPTILAGLNQTLMLALSMVVIVALIAGGGLGGEIFRSVGRLEVGRAAESGLAVLLLAIVLDRISQVQLGRRGPSGV
jgi:glycine betaine/proline transport system permease protein